ncbi:hypothetical protein SteCoe_31377 [Stentor coeruleus]|uniref:FHA domain-containing protein n=1 Tax=Stentor coeruleus TaxID=5963 RepID=A0A1R2B1I2_9CILI|nr:hypothetical protein SteCoe_31377 [Stentor coeruleus]
MSSLSEKSINGVNEFLKLLNLTNYNENFNNYTLEELSKMSDKNLIDLGVSIRIHRVKILEFSKLYQASQTPINSTEYEFSEYSSQETLENYDFSNNSPNNIILTPVSGLIAGMVFKIGELGAKIGRGNDTDITISDNFVSRKHCEIRYKNKRFEILDTGSTTGTFLRIYKKYPLDVGTMFQVGQCEFKVLNIVYTLEGYPVSLELLNYEGPNAMPLIITKGGVIGRSRNCEICVKRDSLMSLEHCRIYTKNNQFYIRDLNSLNFTWIRMSPEGEFSNPIPLSYGDQVKVGFIVLQVSSVQYLKY